jgi:hypothetical protein
LSAFVDQESRIEMSFGVPGFLGRIDNELTGFDRHGSEEP